MRATDSIRKVLHGVLEHLLQGLLAAEIGAGESGHRLGLGAGLLGGLGRRTAISTAPLTKAGTATKTTSATAWSGSATVSV